jgi:hypothetical protein
MAFSEASGRLAERLQRGREDRLAIAAGVAAPFRGNSPVWRGYSLRKQETTRINTDITPTELADRLAIRELVDAYACCADRRDADGQKSLFTEDTHFVVYMDGAGTEPTQPLSGREALTPVFDALNTYQATMHLNGQTTIAFDDDRATGESYCIAHHLFTDEGERKLMVAHLRYHDTFRQARPRLAVRRAQALRRLDRDSILASLAPRGSTDTTGASTPQGATQAGTGLGPGFGRRGFPGCSARPATTPAT